MNEISMSLLRDRITTATSAWADARAVADELKIPKVGTMRAVLDNMTARLPQLQDRRRKRKIEIAWLEACQNTATMTENATVVGFPCDFTGWSVGSNKQTIEINRRWEEVFLVPAEEDTIDNLFSRDELFNEGYIIAQKNLAEKINQYFISKLVEFAGPNKFSQGLGSAGLAGPNAWNLTKIPYANTMDANFQSVFQNYLLMAQRFNLFRNPYLIEGGFLQLTNRVDINVSPSAMVQYKFGDRTVYSDMENFINFGSTGLMNDAFLVARGALAFFSLYNYETQPKLEVLSNDSFITMSRPLLGFQDANGQPIMIDITHKRLKTGLVQSDYPGLLVDNRCKIYDVYHMEVKGDLFLNPLSCLNNATGVIQIEADASLPYKKTQNSVFYTQALA